MKQSKKAKAFTETCEFFGFLVLVGGAVFLAYWLLLAPYLRYKDLADKIDNIHSSNNVYYYNYPEGK